MDKKKEKILKISGVSALGVAAIVFASLFTWKCVTGGNGGNSGGGEHDPNALFLTVKYNLAEENIMESSTLIGPMPQTIESYKTVSFEYTGYLGKIDWGDGSEPYTSDEYYGFARHTYDKAIEGTTYDIKIYGDFVGFTPTYLNGSTEPQEAIRPYDFGVYMFTEAEFAEGVTLIPERCLALTEIINKITLPSTVTEIGMGAFLIAGGVVVESNNDTSLLTTINLPEGLKKIGAIAFTGCTCLTEIELPSTLEYIGTASFAGCLGLDSVTIPDSLKYLGGGAFEYCQFTEFNCNWKNITFIGDDAFWEVDWLTTELILPEHIEYIGNNLYYQIIDKDNIEDIELSIPTSLSKVGEYAFNNIGCIKGELDLSHVSSVDSYAFYNCWSDTCTGTNKLVIKVPKNYNDIWNGDWLGSESEYSDHVTIQETETII